MRFFAHPNIYVYTYLYMNIQTTYVLAYGKAVAMPSNWLRCVLLVELGFGSIILVNTKLPICMYIL